MPRASSYAAMVGVLLAASACSATPDPAADPDRAESPRGGPTSEAPFTASELEGDDSSAAPSFRGRLPGTLAPAVREVIDEPCTGNRIQRQCSATFTLRRTGPAQPVVLARASTTTDPDGLTWQVRLGFAPAAEALPRPPAGGTLVLETRGFEVEVDRDAEITRDRLVLTGLTKRDAWSLVAQLSGR